MTFLQGRPIDVGYFAGRHWWRNVDRANGPDSCWEWLQSCGSHGYGQTWDGVTVRLAHRVAWTLHYGQQVPEGMTIDHECRNRRCCNPSHLRLMENERNARDNGNARKSHCPQGHAYDDTNTYTHPTKGYRTCRRCARERRR